VATETIRSWLSLLEASFIIYLLQPYYENFGKRIIKAPKLYFIDVGLASYLLGIETPSQLARDPLRGGLFENLVIGELLKTRHNQGLEPNIHFYRDNHGNEIDVIWKKANQLVPIELKSGKSFHPEFLKGIHFFEKIAKTRVSHSYLVYTGSQELRLGNTRLIHFSKASSIGSSDGVV